MWAPNPTPPPQHTFLLDLFLIRSLQTLNLFQRAIPDFNRIHVWPQIPGRAQNGFSRKKKKRKGGKGAKGFKGKKSAWKYWYNWTYTIIRTESKSEKVVKYSIAFLFREVRTQWIFFGCYRLLPNWDSDVIKGAYTQRPTNRWIDIYISKVTYLWAELCNTGFVYRAEQEPYPDNSQRVHPEGQGLHTSLWDYWRWGVGNLKKLWTFSPMLSHLHPFQIPSPDPLPSLTIVCLVYFQCHLLFFCPSIHSLLPSSITHSLQSFCVSL